MCKHSMDDVQKIINDLNSPLDGLVDRRQKVAILRCIALEPGWAESEAVQAYAQEFLRTWAPDLE